MVNVIAYKNKDGSLVNKVKCACNDYVAGEGTFLVCLRNHYSKDTAVTSWKIIFEDPLVQEYIKSMEDQACSVAIATRQDVLAFWTSVMADSEQKTSDRVNASKLLAQTMGMMDLKTASEKKQQEPFVIDIAPRIAIEAAQKEKKNE